MFTSIAENQSKHRFERQNIVGLLAEAIRSSGFLEAKSTLPYIAVHGLDTDVYKAATQHLFLTCGSGEVSLFPGQPIQIQQRTGIAAGTFRNSLYLEPWRQFTNVQRLFLRIRFRGRLCLRFFQVKFGTPPELLLTQPLENEEPQMVRIQLPNLHDYAKDCRVFWDIAAEGETVEVYEATYETDDSPQTEGRLVVLLRTYGRTEDIKKLFDKFSESAKQPEYRDLFQRLYFVALDTSAGIQNAYPTGAWSNLNYSVLQSANLGGGGNVSHLLYIVRSAFEQLQAQPDDLLILDDDLEISVESLRRYAAFCRYRRQEVVCSLPVLMKSEPIVVWEDGGYWGRLNPSEELSIERNSLFPTLVRHGWRLKGYDHLDEFTTINYCEYSTFIFFGLSYKAFLKLEYPTAFFLRGDDIEYSLRVNRMGMRLFTNPNLCAWHEPAHSYVQEYMAILHGLIINLSYGAERPSYYIDFFEKRIKEHASVLDDFGLLLYTEVLQTLVEETPVLQLNFQIHYLEKFKFFKTLEQTYESLSPFILEQVYSKQGDIPHISDLKAAPQGTLVVPFIHMGDRSHLRFKSVLLHNPHSQLYRHINAVDPVQRQKVLKCKSRFYQMLEKFVDQFGFVVERWQTRMKQTQQPEFWVDVNQKTAGENRMLIWNTASDAVEPVKPSQQQHQERATATFTTVSTAPSKAEGQDDAFLQKSVISEMTIENSEMLGMEFLPVDFNPELYLERNPDVAQQGCNPVEHYLQYGWRERRVWK